MGRFEGDQAIHGKRTVVEGEEFLVSPGRQSASCEPLPRTLAVQMQGRAQNQGNTLVIGTAVALGNKQTEENAQPPEKRKRGS